MSTTPRVDVPDGANRDDGVIAPVRATTRTPADGESLLALGLAPGGDPGQVPA